MRPLLSQVGLGVLLLAGCSQSPKVSADVPVLSGERAMDHVRALVAFGPRPPGSPEIQKCREYIEQQLRGYGYQIEEDAFVAETPYGAKKMVNLIARKGAGDKSAIALASHYDTKYMEGKRFVGANDGGSSTGLLIELARVLASNKGGLDYWFLFLDGEEAFVDWSTFDSTYGSRHLARRWKQEGVAARVKALILLDMVGDKDLGLLKDANSTKWLSDLMWDTATKVGLGGIVTRNESAMEDDHIPFLDVGIPCVDLIDFTYPPWHTDADTLDKISPESMEKVGNLVLAVLPALQKIGSTPR
ncbi:MAG TPA: M28 family peptidase [Acidobacteriota bacterium]|nr:M28 family peptidase [Acidobacteriota bacterium]